MAAMTRARRVRGWLSCMLLAAVWIAACGSPPPPEDQAGLIPTATAPAPVATSTEEPPTAVPSSTATKAPTPTATRPADAPVIVDLQDLSISDGERFPRLRLVDHVVDADHEPADIDWEITGGEELEVRQISGKLIISLPAADWTGTDTLRFEACDPDGNCDSQEIVCTVRAENDAPVVRVGGQIIMPGEAFVPIQLEDCGRDEDNAYEELEWSYSGNTEVAITIEDGQVLIEAPNPEWLGSETVRFEACDPEGACGAGEAVIQVMERSEAPVEVTYIGNAGFLVQMGTKRVMIDGLAGRPAPPSDVAEALTTGQPPFDGIDLILATHSHDDHFSADKVKTYLEHNPETVFVGPYDTAGAVDQVTDLTGQIIPIRLDQRAGERLSVVVNGIGVECFYLSHGGPILNLGFVVTADGRRIFHSGDMDPSSVSVGALKGLGLPGKEIDVAFVAHFMLSLEENHAHVIDGIAAEYVVPMHYQFTFPQPDYELMATHFPDAIVFRAQMESWAVPE